MHNQLIKTAEYLANRGTRPRQADLKRAISTAYYAMFHALAKNNADKFISRTNNDGRADRAWLQTYRALEHRKAKNACERCYREQRLGFPEPIRTFASYFVTMQKERYEADYNPASRFSRQDVLAKIEGTRTAIRKFTNSRGVKDKQAFAAFILFPHRQK